MVADIHVHVIHVHVYAVVKNIGSMRTKGVNIKLIPQCTTFHEILSSCKFGVCRCYGY